MKFFFILSLLKNKTLKNLRNMQIKNKFICGPSKVKRHLLKVYNYITSTINRNYSKKLMLLKIQYIKTVLSVLTIGLHV